MNDCLCIVFTRPLRLNDLGNSKPLPFNISVAFFYLYNKHRKVYLRTFDVQVLRLFALAENSAVFVLTYKPTLVFGFTQHLSSGAMQCWS